MTEKNALAELAERMRNWYESQTSWWQDDIEGKDFDKAQCIITELAKVPFDAEGAASSNESWIAVTRSRAIAEEGGAYGMPRTH